ncbi:hypothetical protein Nepgr_004373 [Nepenthes gracilis]|uniref:DUF3741 domain-containing protein n=1 Tax=Nepenthes gracilis TaxID=150966 RepID=A0AAD3XF08_NEPGR|nr:hypothetical protein Nepgr_004373 [Nepenthes gracilis]
MNGIQLNGKVHYYEKPIPGCFGRIVNLVDLTSSTAGNRLLTEKPHSEGSPSSGSTSDASRMSSDIGDVIEDKVIVSESRRCASGKSSEGNTMKMLIAQEMSKDLESKHNPLNVVAKLMGLDALPQQRLPDLAVNKHHSDFLARNSHSEMLMGFQQQEHDFFSREIDCEVHQYQAQNKCRDIYEIRQQFERRNFPQDVSPWKDRCNENKNDEKMAFVRQKFIELKRLAMDEALHQTKEFQDALDVLNSHRDLFIMLLQEQNSLFTQNLYAGHSICSPQETKRIIVLRPSKPAFDDKFVTSGKKSENQIKKLAKVYRANGWHNHQRGFSSSIPTWKPDNTPTQPTRIVVLKPNIGKIDDHKAVGSPILSSQRNLHGGSFPGKLEDDETREAREVAKEITQQICKNLAGNRRDETLLSSVISNGYVGNESSCNKSMGNLSDSEVMSPTTRHPWDHVRRCSSPYSSSSFSRASYTPESSVCREARKRLSERWAMMMSNGSRQEDEPMWGSSCTLAEMLALSDFNKPERYEGDCSKVQGPRGSTSCLNSNLGIVESVKDSPRSLQRSKSLPASSTANGCRLNVEVSSPEVRNTGSAKAMMKVKSTSSSFKGKFMSLFSPRSKKSGEVKSGKYEYKNDSQTKTADIPGSPVPPAITGDDMSKCMNTSSEEDSSTTVESPCCSILPALDGKRTLGVSSFQQAGLSVSKSATHGIPAENQDQPSPISVLDSPFEEDEKLKLGPSGNHSLNQHGNPLLCLSKSNIIDKSPLIGSIARTVSWDECCAEQAASSYPLKTHFVSPGIDGGSSGGEWLFLVQSLLSAAGLHSIAQLCSNFSRWHSPESPLDPSLREKYMDLTADKPLHEAKRQQLRSNSMLVFDCTNAAVVNITRAGSNGAEWDGLHGLAHSRILENALCVEDDGVWALMQKWFSSKASCLAGDGGSGGGDDNSPVERLVRKEVVCKGCGDSKRSEVDDMGKEIEGKLLEELVEEYVVEWTCRR